MINLFESNHNEVGSSDKNLILKTQGKVKIQWGRKFIDLLDEDGNINCGLKKIIKPVKSSNQINKNGFYYLDGDLIACVEGEQIKICSENSNAFVSFLNDLNTTPEQKFTAQKNIGICSESAKDINITDGIVYVVDEKSVYIVSNGTAKKFELEIPNPYPKLFVITKEDQDSNGSLVITGQGLTNGLIFDNLLIYSDNGAIYNSNVHLFIVNNNKVVSITQDGIITKQIGSEGANTDKGYRIYNSKGKYILDIDTLNVRDGINVPPKVYPLEYHKNLNVILNIKKSGTGFSCTLKYKNTYKSGDKLLIYDNDLKKIEITIENVSEKSITTNSSDLYEGLNNVRCDLINNDLAIGKIETKYNSKDIGLISKLNIFYSAKFDKEGSNNKIYPFYSDNLYNELEPHIEELNYEKVIPPLGLIKKLITTPPPSTPTEDSLPLGSIILWSFSNIPEGWHICDGSILDRTEYSEFYNTFGTGRLPDFRGRFPVGFNSSNTNFDSLNETGGEEQHTLLPKELPEHYHSYISTGTDNYNEGKKIIDNRIGNTEYPCWGDTNYSTAWDLKTSSVGGNLPFSIIPPYYTLYFIIKIGKKSGESSGKKNLTEDEFSYSSTSGRITDTARQVPYLINTHNLSVTYSSSNESVATINSSGYVTAKSSGISDISAKFNGNDEYNSKTAYYGLTVDILDGPVIDDDETRITKYTNDALDEFNSVINTTGKTLTRNHIRKLVEEAFYLYFRGHAKNDIPVLYVATNFPTIFNYWNPTEKNTKDEIFKVCVGWLCAMQLAELDHTKRTRIFKIGYEYGGYTMNTNIYGYGFKTDPNIARLVASIIYSTLRRKLNPSISTMMSEVGGSKYGEELLHIYDRTAGVDVTNPEDLYTDLRQFISSAPGPYDSNYNNRSKLQQILPGTKNEYNCLLVDMIIYNNVINNYNWENYKTNPTTVDNKRVIQAIADKDLEKNHLFGSDNVKEGCKYNFNNAIFGITNLGISNPINISGDISNFVKLCEKVGRTGRKILFQAVDLENSGNNQYGRLRPGCSWVHENEKHDSSNNNLNVLADFDIEDYTDDIPGGYDDDGNWVIITNYDNYNEAQRSSLYANSYPSGHSSGIWAAAMAMCEIYPDKADKIMIAANNVANSRIICRYHWNSDTIQGRVIGTIVIPVAHATSDYDTLLNLAIAEAGT